MYVPQFWIGFVLGIILTIGLICLIGSKFEK